MREQGTRAPRLRALHYVIIGMLMTANNQMSTREGPSLALLGNADD